MGGGIEMGNGYVIIAAAGSNGGGGGGGEVSKSKEMSILSILPIVLFATSHQG